MVKKQWTQGYLSDIIDSLVAGVSVNSGEQDGSSSFFILKTSAISKGKLNLSEKKPVLPQEVARLKCSLRQKTILISRMNTPELVGECAYVECDDPRIYLPDRIWQSNFKKDIHVSAKWLSYLLSSKKYRLLIQNCATGTSNSMKNISKKELLGLEILYPSFCEQDAIAEVLSDVDSLISSLQKLIEKKKAIKQGAMQELLTGKKRLPGLEGKWEYYKIGKICSVLKGQMITEKNAIHGNIPVIAGGKAPAFYHNMANRGPNVITISASGASAGYIAYHTYPIFASDCSTIKAGNQYDIKFIYYALLYRQRELIGMQTGGAQPHIHPKAIKTLLVPRIKKEEQRAIAQILSDMDSEIAQLEKKLFKYQQLKEGMMQQLLTGRIRLEDADRKEQQETQVAPEKQPQPAHNQHFDDAVMIAGIVNAFYSKKYPLGRKKVQKLLYLIRRKEQADISAFHKKAAGPYADEVRYKGGEPIAQQNRYIQVKRSDKGSCFEKGAQIQQALAYLRDWERQTDIDWLVSQFQYTSVNELELLATVDMAICDLRREGREISVATIKELIHSIKEWRDKLGKAYFKDVDIQRAIKKCLYLFEN